MPLDHLFVDAGEIKGKQVFVVEAHHKALAAWALVRRNFDKAPNLVTIDHHTDTKAAFFVHAYWQADAGHVADAEAFRVTLVEQIDWRNDYQIIQTIAMLRHDEHIDAATRSGMVDKAFCIQLGDPDGSTAASSPNIYVVPFKLLDASHNIVQDEDCELRRSNEIIEAHHLDSQLKRGAAISRVVGLVSAANGSPLRSKRSTGLLASMPLSSAPAQ